MCMSWDTDPPQSRLEKTAALAGTLILSVPETLRLESQLRCTQFPDPQESQFTTQAHNQRIFQVAAHSVALKQETLDGNVLSHAISPQELLSFLHLLL